MRYVILVVALILFAAMTKSRGVEYQTEDVGVIANPTLDEVFDVGKVIDGANSLANSVKISDGSGSLRAFYTDGSGNALSRTCNQALSTCTTPAVRMEVGSDFDLLNESGTVCNSIDSVTGALTLSSSGTCVPNILIQGGTRTLGTTTVSTNPYTMLTTDCGKELWVVTGAGEIDLIADPTNGGIGSCVVCFYEINAITLLLDPNSTDIIEGTDASGTPLTLAAGDRLQLANVVGNQVCLMGYSTTQWKIVPGIGVLTDAN